MDMGHADESTRSTLLAASSSYIERCDTEKHSSSARLLSWQAACIVPTTFMHQISHCASELGLTSAITLQELSQIMHESRQLPYS